MNSHSSQPDTYVPGNLVPKVIYLVLSGIVFGIGAWYAWEPLSRMLWGETTSARVAEIRIVTPGEPEQVYRYRRPYRDTRNFHTSFQHYVVIPIDGMPVLHRISVDSRFRPADGYNVNDRISVVYFPDDERRLAFAHLNPRTWGAAGLFLALGATMLATSIPMLLAVGKPITIDPEGPAPDNKKATADAEEEASSGDPQALKVQKHGPSATSRPPNYGTTQHKPGPYPDGTAKDPEAKDSK